MAFNLSVPECYVEVYPFEGGGQQYEIQGGQILSCTVTKAIRTSESAFEIELAPGGPNGPNRPPVWSDIVTPISFVLIGMARGQYRQIVMIGVITNIIESTRFEGRTVQRVTVLIGKDFTYFFETFNYVVLAYLGLAYSAIGQSLGNANLGFPAILSGRYLDGPPDQLGQNWYHGVMDGTDGILAKTTISYQGNRLSFSDVLAVYFEKFPNFSIPLGDMYLPSQGSWLEKFRIIFEWPWYEFFVTTAPVGFYPDPSGGDWNTVAQGTQFTMRGIGAQYPSVPVAIARKNPLPHITMQASNDSFTPGQIDTTDWQGLNGGTIFYNDPTPDAGFIESTIRFSEEEVRNFYLLNPRWSLAMLGIDNASVTPALFVFLAADDAASLHRYGYRPAIMETHWFNDVPPGNTAQKNAGNKQDFQSTYGDLLSRLFSYYEPTSLMMRGSVKAALRPDIMPGCIFQYNPFKSEGAWQFYIDGFVHKYEFGGRSTTTLHLSRGLPAEVYGDSGLLTDIHLGKASRVNGGYQSGLPSEAGGSQSEGLRIVNLAQNVQQVLNDFGKIYTTAQTQTGTTSGQ